MTRWAFPRPDRARAARTVRALQLALLAILIGGLAVGGVPTAAQSDGPRTLSGSFSVAYEGYNDLPLLVGLIDASPYLGDAPVTLPPPDEQVLGSYRGVAGAGTYTLDLPPAPRAIRPFDVTGGAGPSPAANLMIFDVRLMSDVARRGYMVPNEDNIASSARIGISVRLEGGSLLVWAGDSAQQFPTGPGPDGVPFTADDPRAPIPAGWTLVNLDSAPYTFSRESAPRLDLITTGMGDVIDYADLPCDQMIPALIDRVASVYPFTDLYGIDWPALRAQLVASANLARDARDCELIVREFGNAIPDGHVNFYLPALRSEINGTLGMLLTPLSDGRIAVGNLGRGGPAQRAGIAIGAVILAWDGRPIEAALTDVVLQTSNASTPHALLAQRLWNLNRGPFGSSVTITYQNPGAAPATLTLTRADPQPLARPTPTPPVTGNVLPSGVGYIRIEQFISMSQLNAFDAAVTALIERGAPGIILDVRANPGGFSQISDAMASRFFEEGFLIGRQVQEGRLTFQMQVDPRPPIFSGPVAVLVDVNTASAGELFAYTFASTGRGLIVGSTPSGGLAGTVSGGQYLLPGGAFIQVPTGNLLDDQGREIVEGKGVPPDVLVPVTVESLVTGADDVLAAAEAVLLAVPAR